MAENQIKVTLGGHDEILCQIDQSGDLKSLEMMGCFATSEHLSKWVKTHGKNILKWPLPTGSSHSELLLKELILKAKSEWTFPIADSEICHCRTVPTLKVDQSILSGAHTVEAVSRQTQACTGCGTCRSEIQKLIDFRLVFRL